MADEFLPLDGIRVVEMSHMIMGPACGMFLRSLGAEVIKVEPPDGDRTRSLSGMGRPMFPLFNRGKKSVSFDIDSEDGQQTLYKLLATADVFIENFSDATLEKKGLEAGTLKRRYPSLIVASCKGFLSGPYKTRTALDEVVQMMTGLAYMTGPTGRPLRVGSSANDIMAGLFGAFSVLAALMERQAAGRGRDIRIGLFENSLLLVAQHMVELQLEGQAPPPMPERNFSWPIYDIFTDINGAQLFVGAVTQGQWEKTCIILGLESFLEDPRLQNRMDRIRERSRTIPIVADRIAQRSTEDLTPQFEQAGLPFSPVQHPGDMLHDPHVTESGGLTTSLYDGQAFKAPTLPFEIDGTRIPAAGDVPAIGQHNMEILKALR